MLVILLPTYLLRCIPSQGRYRRATCSLVLGDYWLFRGGVDQHVIGLVGDFATVAHEWRDVIGWSQLRVLSRQLRHCGLIPPRSNSLPHHGCLPVLHRFGICRPNATIPDHEVPEGARWQELTATRASELMS